MPYTAPKNSVKEVRYLNKDFTSFKENLIEFTKIRALQSPQRIIKTGVDLIFLPEY